MIRTQFRWVFEKTKVERRMSAKRRRVLFRIARYGQRVMKSLFRKRKNNSKAGQPPTSHGKRVLRANTRFDVEGENYCVAGPMLLRGQSKGRVKSQKPAPALLNEGGTARIRAKNGKRLSARYKARPFVERARDKTVPKFVEFMESERL